MLLSIVYSFNGSNPILGLPYSAIKVAAALGVSSGEKTIKNNIEATSAV